MNCLQINTSCINYFLCRVDKLRDRWSNCLQLTTSTSSDVEPDLSLTTSDRPTSENLPTTDRNIDSRHSKDGLRDDNASVERSIEMDFQSPNLRGTHNSDESKELRQSDVLGKRRNLADDVQGSGKVQSVGNESDRDMDMSGEKRNKQRFEKDDGFREPGELSGGKGGRTPDTEERIQHAADSLNIVEGPRNVGLVKESLDSGTVSRLDNETRTKTIDSSSIPGSSKQTGESDTRHGPTSQNDVKSNVTESTSDRKFNGTATTQEMDLSFEDLRASKEKSDRDLTDSNHSKVRPLGSPKFVEARSTLAAAVRPLSSSGSLPNVQTLVESTTSTNVPHGRVLQGRVRASDGSYVTLADAIQNGLYDVKSCLFVDPMTGRRLTLAEAVGVGMIDGRLMNDLMKSSGLRDPRTGREVSVADAMKLGLFDPATGLVHHLSVAIPVSLFDAVAMGLLDKASADTLAVVEIRTKSTSLVHGLYGLHDIGSASLVLSIHDIVSKGLYDTRTGKIIEPITNERLTLEEAIARGIINTSVREVVNTSSGEVVTIEEAVRLKIIDAKSLTFYDVKSSRRMNLDEAFKLGFIRRPASLSDAITQGLLDPNGLIEDIHTER